MKNDILDAGWYTIISGNNMNLIPILQHPSSLLCRTNQVKISKLSPFHQVYILV